MDHTLEELRALRTKTRAERQENVAKRGQRKTEIARLHLVEKKTLAEIGKMYGISRQRVHAIINSL